MATEKNDGLILVPEEAGEDYDIYLAGPWERFALEPYKTRMREEFPGLKFFDPELQPGQENGTWFEGDLLGLRNSRVLLNYVCPLPFPGNAGEAGMFYVMHSEGVPEPLENLIIVWNPKIQPQHSREFAEKMGLVFDSLEEAIDLLDRRLSAHGTVEF